MKCFLSHLFLWESNGETFVKSDFPTCGVNLWQVQFNLNLHFEASFFYSIEIDSRFFCSLCHLLSIREALYMSIF